VYEELWWRLERRETTKSSFYHSAETDHARNQKQIWTIVISAVDEFYPPQKQRLIFKGEMLVMKDDINFLGSICPLREVLSQYVSNGKDPVTTEKYWPREVKSGV
jgi:hypothetical protein